MILQINNVKTRIIYEENGSFIKKFDDLLHTTIDPLDPQRYMKSAFRKHFWDGRVTIYDKKDKSFPTGLFSTVWDLAKSIQNSMPMLNIATEDLREPSIGLSKLPKTIKLETPKGTIIFDPKDEKRGYQYDAVKYCLENQRAIVNASVGSGKTLVAEGLIQTDLKDLSSQDKIFFIVHNKIIAYQTKKRFEDSLHIPIGFWGDGVKDIQQVTVCIVGTLASGLKKPEDTVKLTSTKDKILKSMVKKYIPVFEEVPNVKIAIKNYIRNNQPEFAYEEPIWTSFSDMVQPNMTNKDIFKIFESYKKKYDKLLQKKASKVYDKYNSTIDILNTVKVVISDECLTGDTLVTMNDNSQKYIKDIKKGDILRGNNKVLDTLIKAKQPVARIEYNRGVIEGSETHPLAILRNNKFIWLPIMQIRETDKLLVPVDNKPLDNLFHNTDEEKIAKLVGLIIADGHILKGSKHADGNYYRSNTVRVNVSKDFDWYRRIFKEGMESIGKIINKKINVVDKLDTRKNLLLRVTDKEVLDYLDKFEIPFGKKSGIVKTPSVYNGKDNLLANMYNVILNCEGDINENKFESTRFSFVMCSKQLVLEIENWFMQHGVNPAFLHIQHRKATYNDSYRLSFGGGYYNILVDNFNILKRKQGTRNSKVTTDSYYNGYLVSKIKHIIHDLPEQQLYDLNTQNHTFIANNILSHNCQHVSSNQYQLVMSNLINARQRIGLSGTIDQKDELKWSLIQGVISPNLFKISNKQMIDSGVSAKPYIQFIPIDEPKNLDEKVKNTLPANFDETKQALAYYQETYSQGIIHNDYRNGAIVQLLSKLYETGNTTLIVVSSIEHGEMLQDSLAAMDIPSYFLRGDVSMEKRQEVIDMVKEGTAKIVFGTSVVNEGMDIPNLKYLVYASAGKASTTVIQRVGRVIRKSKGKDTAIVFDFMDNMSRVLYKQSIERRSIYRNESFEIINNQ